MKRFKKLLAVVLAMIMLMSALPMTSVGAISIYPELELGVLTDVNIGEPGKMYSFKPENDGWYKFYSLGEADTFARLYKNITQIDSGDDSSTDQNFVMVVKLEADTTYYLKVGAYVEVEEYVDIQVGVEEAVGVEAMEITQYPYNTTVIEGFEYETLDATGLEVAFTLTDGTTVDWSFEEYGMVGDFAVYTFPDETADGEPCLSISCGDLSEEIVFTVVESSVESIEYSCDTSIEIYEHSSGYFVDDVNYHYFYSIPEEAVITVNYKDGTAESFGFFELAYMNYYDTQEEQPWTAGSDNYVTVTYFDVETTIPVTILESPFVNVAVNCAPSREYIFGDYDYGYLDENGEYTLWAIDLTGLSFTVEYEDGSTETFDDDDFDVENMLIDGYEYFIKDCVMTEPGTVDVVLCYKGEEITYKVDVIEPYIESIEVITPPNKVEFEKRYYADYTGIVVKINYKDGTSAQATANEDTMSYYYDGSVVCTIQVGDDVVSIYNEENFDTGEMHDYFTCAGVGLVYDGVTYVDSREVSSITADNVSMSGDGMVINVVYEDGESEEIVLDVIDYLIKEEDYTDACAMTKNGVLLFSIEKWLEPSGELIGYNVYTLGSEYFVDANPYLMGDVDLDGVVTVLDATALQRGLAGLDTLSDEALLSADIDGDGVSVMDATLIQRMVAGFEN